VNMLVIFKVTWHDITKPLENPSHAMTCFAVKKYNSLVIFQWKNVIPSVGNWWMKLFKSGPPVLPVEMVDEYQQLHKYDDAVKKSRVCL